ncbi:hypothetical protein ACV07N_14555 [Roseivirga echinicomitans]
MNTKWLKIVLCMSLFIAVNSCGNTTNQTSISQDLESYLTVVYGEKLEDALYIIVPSNSCDGCRISIYRNLLLTKHLKRIKLIFAGEVLEAQTNQYLQRLKIMGVVILNDPNKIIADYGLLAEDYPMELVSVVDVYEGKVVSLMNVKPNMINGEVDIRKEVFKGYIQ